MFIFGEEWAELTKTAVFWQNKDTRYEMLLDEADSCDIPWEAQKTDGFMFVGVIGRKGDTVLPSKILICPVSEGTPAGSSEHNATQSLYDQMISGFAYTLTQAQVAAERAEQATVNTPYIGENGNWFVWNIQASAYVDSGTSALGEKSKGDMLRSVYDTDGDGTVDNSASLGGIAASSYATTAYVASYVDNKITSALEASY